MFIIYMNDIVRCSTETIYPIYANDTTLYVSGVDLVQCKFIMNQCLSRVHRCLYTNKLNLNVSKTDHALINIRKAINLNALPSITLINVALERKETVKF